MSILSDDELMSIRAVLDLPAAPTSDVSRDDVHTYPLFRDHADTGPAVAAIDDRAQEVADVVEAVLASRTHRPWTVHPRVAYGATIAELAGQVPMPVACMWDKVGGGVAAFILLDLPSTQQIVNSLMGVEMEELPQAEKLGALDRKVAARLFRSLGEALHEAGVRGVSDRVRIETDWRRIGPELQKADLVVLPIEIKEPVEARLDIVVVASATVLRPRGQSITIGAHLPTLEVDIVAELGGIQLSLGELTGLTPGTVVALDTVESSPISVLVQGERKFEARAEAVGGRVVLKLTGTTSDGAGSADSP